MRFWDSSAIVPLCLLEPETPHVRRLLDSDPSIVVWWGTRTECISALSRRRRDGQLGNTAEARARIALATLAGTWSEVLPVESVRDRAERLLAVHALRSADAFQLAAALLWARERTREHEIVCLDERLTSAAALEGFSILPG